ncbi:MAG: hypothetical protein GXP38_05730 [Chloroflexi bacterium]|nr:hypothetical protein [Chloroflexota bacterium]
MTLYVSRTTTCVSGGRPVRPTPEARAAAHARIAGLNPRAAACPLHAVLAPGMYEDPALDGKMV